MIGNKNIITVSRRAWILLVFLALSMIFAGPAHAALVCSACHTMPPSDSAGTRDASTGAFKGNHAGHAGVAVNSCTPCHGNGAASYTSAHSTVTVASNKAPIIKIASKIHNYSTINGRARYSGGTFFNQTSVPPNPIGTCSNVNCHFESVTPAWGTANFASPTDCNKCHGAAPVDGNHPKHTITYFGTPATTNACVKCHSDHTTEAKPFAHATSAGNRGLVVSFAAAPNNGFGRYTGNVSYPKYLPSQIPPRNGTCTSTYCHSPGTKASTPDPPNMTAQWGGSLTCKGCHKSDFASGSAMSSGSHNMHITSNYNPFGYNLMTCVKCHATTATAGLTIANTSRHVNGQVEIAFDSTSSAANGSYKGVLATPASPMVQAPGITTGGACTSVYCHSSGQGANGTWPPIYQSPQWGVGSTGKCGTCHGEQVNHGGFSLGTPLTTGSHTKHLQYQMGFTGSDYARCVVCHAYTRTGLDPAGCNSNLCHPPTNKNHANYSIDVVMPDYYGATATYNGTTKPGTGYSTCSTVYCHSDGLATPVTYYTPTWGTSASGNCGTCHGANAAAPPASARHAKHVGSVGPYEYACALCHAGIVKHNANSITYAVISTAAIIGSFDGSKLHVNKSRDVKFDTINPFGTYSSYNLTCNSTYCHSIGNTSVAAGRLPGVYGGKIYAKPKWTDAGPLACNACHGRSTSNGMPDYANGKMGSLSSNSHPKHVSSSGIACVECHEKTTKNGTTIRSTFPSKHANGAHDVYFNLSGNSAAGYYNNVPRTCTATYCHGAGASLAWGGSTYCNSCHSANDATSGGGGINNWGTGISAHTVHVEDTTLLPSKYTNFSTGNLSSSATIYRFGCASCHNPAQATHVSGYASGTYRAQVFFGFTTPGKRPTYTYTGTAGTADNGFAWSNGNAVCNLTYCHSNGAGGNGAAVSWTTTANSATSNTRCTKCHNYTVASGVPMATGTHSKHINGTTYSFSCRKCHAVTTADGSTIADKTMHVSKKINVAFNNSTTAVNGTYNNLASPMSKSPGSAYASCGNTYCHSKGTSTTPSTATPNLVATWNGTLNTTCSGCHGNDNSAAFKMGTVGSVAHAKHVQTYGFGCVKCHAATVSDNRTISNYANHVTQRVNVAFNNSTTAVSGTYNGSATPMTKLPGSVTGACGNTYCHSNGTSVATGVIPTNTSVTWGTAGPLACNSCHGTGGTTGAPNYSHLMELPNTQSGATWTTPANALIGDKAFATYAGTAQGTLVLTNFGYTTAQVADTDTVTGITVVVEGWALSGTTPGNQLNVQLTQNGTVGVGTAKVISLPGTTSAANAEVYATTLTTDLWGAAWTPAQIRATTFGVILKDNDTTSSALNVDMVKVIVHTNRAPKMNNHSSAIGHRVATCDICHNSVTYSAGVYTPNATLHVNRSYNVQASLGYTFAANGGSCATPGNGCHGPTAGKWGGTLGCVDCHNKVITRTKGRPGTTLANVVGEFGLAWGHKKSGRAAVTDDDCIVCHLEGDGTTHKASARHQDGNIDLRDPQGAGETPITNISGGVFTFQRFSTSYAAGSRTSTGQNSNTDIANVIAQKFCLRCHNGNGATNPTARSNNGGTGTAAMPFGGVALGANYTAANGAIGTQGLVNVFSQFSSGNSSYHPVRKPLNRDYPTAARMNDPYKPIGTRGTSGTLSNSVVINCFDCHNQVGTPLTLRTVTAHGNAVTLRGIPAVTGTPTSANNPTLCTVCHSGYAASTATTGHLAGSSLTTINGASGMTAYMAYGCNVCHGSNYATAVVRPVRAQDVHGVNALPTGGATARQGRWSTDPRPYAFIRNTNNLGTHQPAKIGATAYTPQCYMGSTSPCAQGSLENYGPGGAY